MAQLGIIKSLLSSPELSAKCHTAVRHSIYLQTLAQDDTC